MIKDDKLRKKLEEIEEEIENKTREYACFIDENTISLQQMRV